jgi:hypothetical protein
MVRAKVLIAALAVLVGAPRNPAAGNDPQGRHMVAQNWWNSAASIVRVSINPGIESRGASVHSFQSIRRRRSRFWTTIKLEAFPPSKSSHPIMAAEATEVWTQSTGSTSIRRSERWTTFALWYG